MIRHSIHTGLGRGRPELSRLSEGISASLRQFSIAQARCAANDDAPSSSRQRSAAAASELLSMNERSAPRSRPANTTAPQDPRVISGAPLRGGGGGGAARGGFTGFKKFTVEGNGFAPRPASNSSTPTNRGGIVTGGIIRGGFRGRGGGNFANRGGGGGGGHRGGSYSGRRNDGASSGSFTQSRGRGRGRGGRGGRGRGRGRGGRDGEDDRPVRQRTETRVNRQAELEYQRFITSGQDVEPEITAYNSAIEDGVERLYQPAAPKQLFTQLEGYGPAVAAHGSPLAKSAAIITQARMLGGGRPYDPEDAPSREDARWLYKEGHGVFFPSAEAKAWASKTTRKITYENPPKETQTAVLEAALLGKYDGPKFAEGKDYVGTIKSYVKRDGTWNALAERTIEARVKTLLPGAKGAAKPQAKRA